LLKGSRGPFLGGEKKSICRGRKGAKRGGEKGRRWFCRNCEGRGVSLTIWKKRGKGGLKNGKKRDRIETVESRGEKGKNKKPPKEKKELGEKRRESSFS